jgi:hypothetical protein
MGLDFVVTEISLPLVESARERPMNFFKSLDSVSAAKVAALAVISIPVAIVYAFYKMNKEPVEQPLTIEEQYPNEHLGV